MNTKTLVELDLVGYSAVARTLEENVGVEVVARFNGQIQEFVDAGLAAIGADRARTVLATTGDGAILALDQPADAHRFAAAVHAATAAHNTRRGVASCQRWLRIGAATGELWRRSRPEGGQEIGGTVIAVAVQLEAAARPGQLVIDAATFAGLPDDLKAAYGAEEIVAGKRHEQLAVRRTTFVHHAVAPDSRPTVESVLDLFDRLHPRNQIDRLMLLIDMPAEHRPPNTLTLFQRQDAVVDWAANAGEARLAKLDAALQKLIRPPLVLAGELSAALEKQRDFCLSDNRRFRTPHALLAVLARADGSARTSLNQWRPGFGDSLHEEIARVVQDLAKNDTLTFEAFDWPDLGYVREAQSRAASDSGERVSDLDLLIAILRGTSAIRDRIALRLGPDFDKLLAFLDPSEPRTPLEST